MEMHINSTPPAQCTETLMARTALQPSRARGRPSRTTPSTSSSASAEKWNLRRFTLTRAVKFRDKTTDFHARLKARKPCTVGF